MKRMLLAALSAFCLHVSAQITITNAVFPVAGDTLHYATDVNPVGVNPATPSGGNQTWIFTGLAKDNTSQVVFKPANSGLNSIFFPGAELLQNSNLGETYFNVTATKFESMGYAGGDPFGIGLNVNAFFKPALVDHRAPLNFIDVNNQTSSLRLTFPTDEPPLSTIFDNLNLPVNVDSLRVSQTTNRQDIVDAWGVCHIPGGQYPVLRQKRTDYVTRGAELFVSVIPGIGTWVDISTFIGNGGGGDLGGLVGTDTTVTYLFLTGTEKEEIAAATMNDDQSTVSSMRFKNNATVDAPVLHAPGTASISAFPNPAIDWVRFDYVNLPQDEYTLKIFNIIGKEVWKETYQLVGTHHFRVELDNFKKGTYLYSLADKKGNVIGTKRLVVLKP